MIERLNELRGNIKPTDGVEEILVPPANSEPKNAEGHNPYMKSILDAQTKELIHAMNELLIPLSRATQELIERLKRLGGNK